MSETIQLYSFADVDRSGKVRWTAAELGLTVDEQRVRYGAHAQPPYLEMNPYGQVPTASFRGEILVESTAICQVLADAIQEPKLQVDRGEPGRNAYLYWLSVFTETHESRLVECSVSKTGLLGPEYLELHQRSVRRKLGVIARQLPAEGWLAGGRFTLADICAGYCLRLAIQCGFLTVEQVEPYFGRLRDRRAAVESRVFASLKASSAASE